MNPSGLKLFGLVVVASFVTAWSMRLVQTKNNVPKTPTSGTTTWTLADTSFENTPYVSLTDVDSLLGTHGKWVPDRQKWVSEDNKGRSWVFTLDNSFCAVSDKVFNLTYPVRRSADKLWVPVYPLLRLLKDQAGLVLEISDFSKGSVSQLPTKGLTKGLLPGQTSGPGEVIDGGSHSDVTVLGPLECESRANGTLVRVAAIGPLDPEILWVPPNYLARFNHGQLGKGLSKRNECSGLVDKVLFNADHEQVQMTLQTRGKVDTIEMETTQEPRGLQFLVRKVDERKAQETAQLTAKESAKSAAHDKKGTIIIDPGHGGYDQGASVGGVHESQVTLAVGKQLKEYLDKLGYKALLTRDEDKFISLADRPKFASDHGGDLFISLHCNSMEGTQKRKQQISGFTAYILREGESEEDNALARRENEAIQEEKGKSSKGEISPVDWILLEHQLNLYSKQSEIFAEKIIEAFEGFDISKSSTGARQAGFFVLVGAYMPAVLFEMGFLTHDRDRTFMASSKGQKRIAKELSQAIDHFMNYRRDE